MKSLWRSIILSSFLLFGYWGCRPTAPEIPVNCATPEFYQELVERNQKKAEKYYYAKQKLVDNFWSEDMDKIESVAFYLIEQTEDKNIELDLAIGLLRVENPWIDNSAVSSAGAVGLTQVMPRYWEGSFPECGDMYSVEGNICYGLSILRYYLDTEDTEIEALWAYNGCRSRGPHCVEYPDYVYLYAGRDIPT